MDGAFQKRPVEPKTVFECRVPCLPVGGDLMGALNGTAINKRHKLAPPCQGTTDVWKSLDASEAASAPGQ